MSVALHNSPLTPINVGLPSAETASVGFESVDIYRLIPKKAIPKLNRRIERRLQPFLESPSFKKLLDKQEGSDVGVLRHSEVQLNHLLGKGAFSSVYDVKSIRSKGFDENDDKKYVVKILRDRLLGDIPMLTSCAADLAAEALIMSCVDHPNILKLRGWSTPGISGYESGRYDAFFLVLDRLEVPSLNDVIARWKNKAESSKYLLVNRKKTKSQFLLSRLQVAAQLANAVQYLHAHNICHRDLKGGNVGFKKDDSGLDQLGQVQLFDFGIARVVPQETYEDETFKLTGMTGTRRYMSPECGRGDPYNLKTDVYSYAVCLYEILSLSYAYVELEAEAHKELVFEQGHRPAIPRSFPPTLKRILTAAWSPDIKERPSMAQISEELIEQIKILSRDETAKKKKKWWKKKTHLSSSEAPHPDDATGDTDPSE